MARKLVCGVGLNDADYPVIPMVKVDGRWKKSKDRCPFYQVWQAMLNRCYNRKYQQKNPTYVGVTVCDEWLTFSNFRNWMEKQDYKGKFLDKDLLVNENKLYSCGTCIFVDRKINNFLSLPTKGNIPLGVHYEARLRAPYRAQCWDGDGKQQKLGNFSDPMAAHKIWISAKISIAKQYYEVYTCPQLRQGLQRVINKLEYHLENNLEVKSL